MRIGSLLKTDVYRESPDTFRRSTVNVKDLSTKDVVLLIEDLNTTGLLFISALADYSHCFSFPSVSFVVMVLLISMGNKFNKNILLMSFGSSILFYATGMIPMMMARLGYTLPIVGAWFPVLLFVVAGVVLLMHTKT